MTNEKTNVTKVKLIKVRTDRKTIEIILNKKAWNRLIVSIVEFILICITLLAIALILICPVAMIRDWSISAEHLITLACSLAWLGLMWLYSRMTNK
jgi:hypothetical protein